MPYHTADVRLSFQVILNNPIDLEDRMETGVVNAGNSKATDEPDTACRTTA